MKTTKLPKFKTGTKMWLRPGSIRIGKQEELFYNSEMVVFGQLKDVSLVLTMTSKFPSKTTVHIVLGSKQASELWQSGDLKLRL